jgi:two-component system response regulator PilR (NtrC family)
MGLETRSANDLENAKALLNSENFDVCITDMNLPDGSGLELIDYIQEKFPHIPTAVITAYGNMELAIKSLKAGAFDFVSKPVDLEILRNLVTSAISLPSNTEDNLKPTTSDKYQLLGESGAINDLKKQITKLARSQAPVFVHGESGCGKELAARLIHQQSARSNNAFIPVNCGAIPSELVESEFFGHKKGSFTGASSDKQGLFDAANGGTLFLDEVADLPLSMQVKLLRAIQEKAIRPVGAHSEHKVDIRILSASHKNLADLVKNGLFREDLFYRINVIELKIPSLRARKEDIPLLARHFLSLYTNETNLTSQPKFSDEAMQALTQHDFPGNVRELENILERAMALADEDTIQLSDLQLPQTPNSLQTVTNSLTSSDTEVHSADTSLANQEKTSIVDALESTRWNKTAAAKKLGLTLRQLRYRLNKLGID